MAKTILCVLALVVATLAYPADVVPQVPQKTQVVAQLEVHPAEKPINEQKPIQEPVRIVPVQEPIKTVPAPEQVKIVVIDPEVVHPSIQQRAQQVPDIPQIPDIQQTPDIQKIPDIQQIQEIQQIQKQEAQEFQEALEAQAEAEEAQSNGEPEDIPAGAVGPDVASNPDANPEEDKSDLEGANTFWGGWGRRWGGHYYPRRHYGYGHGYGRGYGHYGHYGHGHGYGGWGGYYW